MPETECEAGKIGCLGMIEDVQLAESQVYRALFELAQSISGHHDLDSLCDAVAGALKRVVEFDYLGLILYDAAQGIVRLHTLSGLVRHRPTPTRATGVNCDHPAAYVLTRQEPLIIADLASEQRWPDFLCVVRGEDVRSLTFVPLTNGDRRIGVLAFGRRNPYEPDPTEVSFIQRVASELAVTVDSYLMGQELARERDRLRVLFDITNALISKRPPEDLFSAISEQLAKVVAHDIGALALFDKDRNKLNLYSLHVNGDFHVEEEATSISPEGLPAGEVLATGEPVVGTEPDVVRFPSPSYRKFVDMGFRSSCCIPLTSANGIIGTIDLARLSGEPFTGEDVELLMQVGRQTAIALENSLAFRELAEIKDKLATEKLYLEDEIRFDQNFGNMIGESPAFQAVLKSVQIVAPTEATVLILGDTGTGKELIARAIHELSGRSGRSFVKVNCAAIPASLLESELFGHEKGAFTSAIAQKIGRFELAHQGTLFLDEIGEIPLELQSKLLRAIQEQEFERLGGNRTIRVDARFVAATNRDLKAMVDEGKFRSDLYYRLHVFPLNVPPLRERREDIPLLVRYFTQKYAHRMNRAIDTIPTETMEALVRYDWPGNIRELQNVIERSVILTRGAALALAMPEIAAAGGPGLAAPLNHTEMAMERDRIMAALRDANGIVGGPDGAAARLGLKRTTLQSRMKKLNITREYN